MIFFSHGGGGGYNLSENDWYFPGLGTLFYLLSFFLKTYPFFFFPSDFKLKIFIVFRFSSQVLTQPQKGKGVHSQFRDSPTFNYISELEAPNWVDQHPPPQLPLPVIQITCQAPWRGITLSLIGKQYQCCVYTHWVRDLKYMILECPKSPLSKCFYY